MAFSMSLALWNGNYVRVCALLPKLPPLLMCAAAQLLPLVRRWDTLFTSYLKCYSKMLLKRSKELYITGPQNPNKTGYRPPSLNLLSHAQHLRFLWSP